MAIFSPLCNETIFSAISPLSDSKKTAPIFLLFSMTISYNKLYNKVVLPTDVSAPITVTSPAASPPFIIAFNAPYDLGSGMISSVPRLTNASHTESSPNDTILAGRYALASHQQATKSFMRPSFSISPASLRGSVTTLALLWLNSGSIESTAFFPASSLSNDIMTFSKVSSHSRLSLMSLTALPDPLLMLTTGHLPSNISATASASSSPSVMVT